MNVRIWTVAILLGVAGLSLANGINPPRPAQAGGGVDVTCTDRAAGSVTRIERARLRYGDTSASGLEVKQGNAAYQSVALSDLSRVTPASGNADRDGRVKGVITLVRPAFDVDVLLRVRTDGGALKVAGFTPNGHPSVVEVAACKEIVVRPAVPEAVRDAPKK